MNRKKRLKLLLGCILTLLVILVGYKIYLYVYEDDYVALNAAHIDQIEDSLRSSDTFRFAVVGNIKNSLRIFDKRILPLIRSRDVAFVISAGNAVYDGAEDKYRLLFRGLQKMNIPYVLAAGPNEVEDFGAGKFYRHFGPFFFSFHLKNTFFIFLDSTGHTSWEWQSRWLKEELEEARDYQFRFVVLTHSLFPLPGLDSDNSTYLLEDALSRKLRELFSHYRVTAVFSAGYPAYDKTVSRGVRYVVSGGGGGLLLGQGKERYQFSKVTVNQDRVICENIAVPHQSGAFRETLETLYLFLHSFFYMSLLNFLLVLGFISLIALKVYSLIIRQSHLYRDFNIDEESISKAPLRVAMFTNNYLPFIGGVPLSIDRLYRGLTQMKMVVKVFAPTYPQQQADREDSGIFRCPPFLHAYIDSFPVANIFSRKIEAAFKTFHCDLVHVHHPFWLGRKGLRLGKKHGLPVVLTYHTRLERYTHYLPLPGTILKNIAAHFIIRRFANRCDAIITPTSSTEEYLRNLGVSALVETIPTGINLENYRDWSSQEVQDLRSRYAAPGERLLISVSRMAREKNVDFILSGLAKVTGRTRVPFKCLLVGDGPERERLQKRARALGIDERTVFTGRMDPRDVVGCYLAADLFVFASTSETQGMVLLEAMAGGCPVVAVRASGVYDVVKDGYNGLKVAESTDSWAEAVAGLLEDGRRLSALAENSRRYAANYSEEIIAEKVVALYRRVVVLAQS